MKILLVADNLGLASALKIKEAMQAAWGPKNTYVVIAENTDEALAELAKRNWQFDSVLDLRSEPVAEIIKLCEAVNHRWRPLYVHLENAGSEIFQLHYRHNHLEVAMSTDILWDSVVPLWEQELATKVIRWLTSKKVSDWLQRLQMGHEVNEFLLYVNTHWSRLDEATQGELREKFVVVENGSEVRISLM